MFDKISHKLQAYTKPIISSSNVVKNAIPIPESLLLFLLEKIILYDPLKNCIIKGQAKDWQGLPKSKSLFHTPKGKGFPIGNLTSQLFGNIYMNEFDHFVKEQLGIRYYGRYVDDFILIHPDKAYLKACLLKMKAYLEDNLQLDIHPKKIYLQHYTKGVQYLGTYIKPHRIYIAKRTKNNFYHCIEKWNQLIHQQKQKINEKQVEKFIASMNSYLGILKHYQTYRLRKKMLKRLHPAFYNYVYISGGYAKLVAKKKRIKRPYFL